MYEKEIQYINKQLYITYGLGATSLDHSLRLDLDSLKRVFADNERLKSDMESLMDNVHHSRSDIQRVASSTSALKELPAILTQQYKQARDVYDT